MCAILLRKLDQSNSYPEKMDSEEKKTDSGDVEQLQIVLYSAKDIFAP